MRAPPCGFSDVLRFYGHIQINAVGQIVEPRDWESRNMVLVRTLPGVKGKLYVNREIEEPLRLALEKCVALGDGYQIHTIGCFNPRLKRGIDQLSLHSWGAAVDLNADTNPLGGPGDMPQSWVNIWEAVGWTWGGRWRRPDPMHFQWARGC